MSLQSRAQQYSLGNPFHVEDKNKRLMFNIDWRSIFFSSEKSQIVGNEHANIFEAGRINIEKIDINKSKVSFKNYVSKSI